MKIYNLSLMSDNNVGDLMSSPFDYFDFPVETKKIDTKSEHLEELKGKFIIYGGGGLIHLPSEDYNNGIMQYLEDICDLSAWLISWGVGHNVYNTTHIKYPKSFVTKFRMHGVRDMFQGLPWVPCVSCMSKLFHHNYETKHRLVAVGYGFKNFNCLTMEHSTTPVEELIEFIASGETVLTNSYHGAYWAALLNRKVIVFNPTSTKFYGLPKSIALSPLDTWHKAKPTKNRNFLSLCRRTNKNYHKKVLKLLEDYLCHDQEKIDI